MPRIFPTETSRQGRKLLPNSTSANQPPNGARPKVRKNTAEVRTSAVLASNFNWSLKYSASREFSPLKLKLDWISGIFKPDKNSHKKYVLDPRNVRGKQKRP